MKIFLTGASGILGTDIAREFQLANFEVFGFNSTDIILGNYQDVEKKIMFYQPDIVIHCAALTNVDLCEEDKAAAVLTNVVGSTNVAMAADKIKAKIVYISSCGVYGNGKATPYNELDEPAPVNFHHSTKLEGERAVKERNDNFLIIRPGWLFGGTVQHKKNFVEARRKEAIKNPVLKSAIDKFGSPTYTADLAKQLLLLVNAGCNGTFNVVNEGCASRYDYVSEILKLLGFETVPEGVSSNEFPRKAAMPDNECLENWELNLAGLNNMRGWKEALKAYITSTYK